MMITLAGAPCSGKSTVAKTFALKYNFENISTGKLIRKMAEDMGLDIIQMQTVLNNDKSIDAKIEDMQKEMGKSRINDNLLLDSRLGWYCVPESFKVYVTIPEMEMARRFLQDNERENDQKVETVEEALELTHEGKTLNDLIIEKTATIGEKISFRRFSLLTKNDNEVFGNYAHMGGKIVTLVKLEGNNAELAKDIAMHIAAMRPLYLDKTNVPSEVVDKEKEILTEQAKTEGLKEDKIAMVVNGRINKFYEEVCLNDQNFIKENKMKVSTYVKNNGSNILEFVRYEVGEGMEKKNENFADEVMKQING